MAGGYGIGVSDDSEIQAYAMAKCFQRNNCKECVLHFADQIWIWCGHAEGAYVKNEVCEFRYEVYYFDSETL